MGEYALLLTIWRPLLLVCYFPWIYPEFFADTPRGVLFDFCMSRHRHGLTVRVFPNRMLSPLADLGAAVVAQKTLELFKLQATSSASIERDLETSLFLSAFSIL